MNSVFHTKTEGLTAKTLVSMLVLVLVALVFVATPLSVFAACPNGNNNDNNNVDNNNSSNLDSINSISREQFATILKGFCQAFRADLRRVQGISNSEFNNIFNGNSVKGVLESDKGLNDSDVEQFERNEISIANSDFDAGTTYAPDACQQGNRNTAQDRRDFQSYFNSSEYAGLDVGFIDSMLTDSVRLADPSTSNSINNNDNAVNHNSRTDNVVEPRLSSRRSTIANPCTDRLVKLAFDPPTNTNFYTAQVGGAPAFCRDKVTWNFSNRTVGKSCTFHISPAGSTFTLNFINSTGTQVDSFTTDPGSVMSRTENDIRQVQLASSDLSNGLKVGGMWYTDC